MKAYETLTKESKHRNYLLYGDPDGSVAVQALELAMPNWLLGSENHSKLVVFFFASLILSVMALRIWVLSNEDKNESGIAIDSKSSMKEYLQAVLEDNPRNQRIVGLTDTDIIELYQCSVEVIQFEEELNKKTSFVEIVNSLLRQTRDAARNIKRESSP